MSTNLITAASAVASSLFSAERACDRQVASVAELSLAMIEARSQGNLRFAEGQDALNDVVRAQALAVEARFHLGRAHERLARVAIGRGIDWTMFGDEAQTEMATLAPAGVETAADAGRVHA